MTMPDILCVSIIGFALLALPINIVMGSLAIKVIRIDKINAILIMIGLLLTVATSIISALQGAWQCVGYAISIFTLVLILFLGFLRETFFNK